MEVAWRALPIFPDQLGPEGMEVRFVTWAPLQPGRIDHHEVFGTEVGADRGLDPVARQEDRAAVRMELRRPPGRSRLRDGTVGHLLLGAGDLVDFALSAAPKPAKSHIPLRVPAAV